MEAQRIKGTCFLRKKNFIYQSCLHVAHFSLFSLLKSIFNSLNNLKTEWNPCRPWPLPPYKGFFFFFSLSPLLYEAQKQGILHSSNCAVFAPLERMIQGSLQKQPLSAAAPAFLAPFLEETRLIRDHIVLTQASSWAKDSPLFRHSLLVSHTMQISVEPFLTPQIFLLFFLHFLMSNKGWAKSITSAWFT